MAWSVDSSRIGASSNALYNAGKPLIMADNIYRANARLKLRDTNTLDFDWVSDTWGDPSLEDSDYPISRMYDNYLHLFTRPTTAGDTRVIVGKNTSSNGVDFDYMFLHFDIDGLDFSTYEATVTLQIADDSSFTTNLETIFAMNIADSVPYYDTDETNRDDTDQYPIRILATDLRVSGESSRHGLADVQYWRLIFYTGDVSLTWRPKVYEFWLGQATQLSHCPLYGFSPMSLVSGQSRFTSDNGIITNYDKSGLQRLLQADFPIPDSAERTKWEEILFRSNGFRYPVLYMDNTDYTGARLKPHGFSSITYPGDNEFTKAPLFIGSLEMTSGLVWNGPNNNVFSVDFEEQSPFVADEIEFT